MNNVKIDFPERLQANAFGAWMEKQGFDLFQAYYIEMMPYEPHPKEMEVQYDSGKGAIIHYITIE